jgi:hypothetical protein
LAPDDLAGIRQLYSLRDRVHWSSDGGSLGTGPIRYEGVSPVIAMLPYNGGVLTAFSNCEGNPRLHRIHWSSGGNNLGGPDPSTIRYQGFSPVTAMIAYHGGVLTGFSNCEGNPNLHRVHWSSDGNNLGGPHPSTIRYQGVSPVTAMLPYNGGVLTAFSNCEGNPRLHRIHWSSDGNDLGGPDPSTIRYQGVSPVTAMIAYHGGVLTGFSNCEGNPNLHRVHWSSDGNNLGGPHPSTIRYQGVSPVTAMIPYNGGVLTAFSNCEGNPRLHRIHWSSDGNNLGGPHPSTIRYEGPSRVTAMIGYNAGVLTALLHS